VEAVGVQPDQRLGDHGGRVELVGDRDPVLALETTVGEPAAHLAARARLVGTLALDAPAETGPTMPSGIVVDADDAQVLEPATRQPQQQAIDGRLLPRQADGQERWPNGAGDSP